MNRLITIPVSHYCEKARWALDLAGVPYVEDGRPPALHRLATARYRATTVPVLVCDDGTVLRDSTAIARYASRAAPELGLFGHDAGERAWIERLVARFDRALGPAARLLVYAQTLDDPPRFLALLGAGLVPRRRALLRAARPGVTRVIRHYFGVDEQTARRARTTVADELAFAEAQRGGSRYLVGDRFTAADLTFAALAAPLVPPPAYGGGALDGPALTSVLDAAATPWSNAPGTGVLADLYGRHRVTGVTPAAVN